MRILLLSWSDRLGGAARAALRLHKALRNEGEQSELLVGVKAGDDPYVIGPGSRVQGLASRVAARWDRWLTRHYASRPDGLFSPAKARNLTVRRAATRRRDITHLHWVTNGFLRIEDLPVLGTPIVWSLHDMWALTGGCHYSAGCDGYTRRCGRCPVLKSNDDQDLSRRTWERKRAAWAGLDLTLVASSRWMQGMVRSSSLLRNCRVEVLPNCVDTELFRPMDRATARTAFSLPQDRLIILFGALSATGDRRKGFHLLAPALELLAQRVRPEAVCLAVMGMVPEQGRPTLPFETRYLGVIRDETQLAQSYAAADMLVAPSTEDNLPYMVMEAMSCGIPCVAFDVGGMPDLIEHEENGYLARPFEVDDLERGLRKLLLDEPRRRALGDRARQTVVNRFAPGVVARRHLQLYGELLAARRTGA